MHVCVCVVEITRYLGLCSRLGLSKSKDKRHLKKRKTRIGKEKKMVKNNRDVERWYRRMSTPIC